MSATPEESRAYRAKAKAKGLCPRCQKRKPREGRTTCEVCVQCVIDVQSERRQKGLCPRCGGERMEHTMLTGQVYCIQCNDYLARHKAMNY